MKLTLKQVAPFALSLLIISMFMVLIYGNNKADASAPNGLAARIATSSKLTLAANTALILEATSSCNARIISTGQGTIMLTFRDTDTPTGSFGVYQAASTTVVYDSGQYGCGLVRGLSSTASSITFLEAQ